LREGVPDVSAVPLRELSGGGSSFHDSL
jgi:hypothetical protein